MSSILKNSDQLYNKKVKADEKIKILESINFNEFTNLNELEDYKIKLCSYILSATGDKDINVQNKAIETMNTIVDTINPYLIKSLMSELIDGIADNKNSNVKLNTLKLIKRLSQTTYFKQSIPVIIDPLSYCLSDTNNDVSTFSYDLYKNLIELVDNKDILPLIPHLLDGLSHPSHLPKTIDAITSTTFVQVVDTLTLSAIVPLLMRTFKTATYAVKRQTIVIIENMTKLVQDERSALVFVNKLLPFMIDAQEYIADPEVRSVAERVYKHLIKIQTNGKEQEEIYHKHLSHIKSFLLDTSTIQSEIIHTMYDTNTMTNDNLVKYLNLSQENAQNIVNEFNSNTESQTEETLSS